MKYWLCLFLLASLAIGSNGYSTETIGQIAHIKNTSGYVEIHREKNVITAGPGDYLLQADKIITKDGSAGIIFLDGTLISIGPDSVMDLGVYVFKPNDGEYAFNLFLKKGTATYTSGRLGKMKPDAVNLKTPRATVGIRGTKLILNVK
jgi:hypothetical protein